MAYNCHNGMRDGGIKKSCARAFRARVANIRDSPPLESLALLCSFSLSLSFSFSHGDSLFLLAARLSSPRALAIFTMTRPLEIARPTFLFPIPLGILIEQKNGKLNSI